MKVKIKKLIDGELKLPYKKNADDFCCDVYAVSREEVAPRIFRYGFGFAAELVRDYEPLAHNVWGNPLCVDLRRSPILLDIDLRPRSSVWETGLILTNCEATIDEPYRGEIGAYFYQVIEEGVEFVKNGEKHIIKPYDVGDRIGQIKVGATLPLAFEFADELSQSSRGTEGFGSSGRR